MHVFIEQEDESDVTAPKGRKRNAGMSRTKYEGDNPTIKQLEETVVEFVSQVYRLNLTDDHNTKCIAPDQFDQCYKGIQTALDATLTNDSAASPCMHWGSYFKHCLKDRTANEIIEATSRIFLSSMKLARATMNNFETVISAENLEKQYNQCKEELDRHRVTVIDLQQSVINAQKEQLNSVTTSVQKVKAYSTVLAQNCAATSPKVVKPPPLHHTTPVQQPGREKNLIVFGLPETTDRVDTTTLNKLFEELQEKPKVTTTKRIGERNEKRPRPLLVSLEKRATLLALLKKARNLKDSEQFLDVYLSPDLTPSELKEQKALRSTLKRLRLEDPDGCYFIRNNVIQVG